MWVNILETGSTSNNPLDKNIGWVNILGSSLESKNIPDDINKKLVFLDKLNTNIFWDKKDIIDGYLKEIENLESKFWKGFDDETIISYINKEISKIDQAFQDKIKAVLSGEKSSEETKEIEVPTTEKKWKVTYDGMDSDVSNNSPDIWWIEVDTNENESVSVGGISVGDLELMKDYLEFKWENTGESKYYIEYLEFIKVIILSNNSIDKQLAVKKYFIGLLEGISKTMKEYLENWNINITSELIEEYKSEVEKLKENTKTELKEAKKSIYNNLKDFWENSSDVFWYRLLTFNSELQEWLENILEMERLKNNESVKNEWDKIKLNDWFLENLSTLDKNNEEWYKNDTNEIVGELLENNLDYFRDRYKYENWIIITDKSIIIKRIKEELNINTRKSLEASFDDLKLQLSNWDEHILKIPWTEKTIYFDKTIDRNKAIVSTMYLYKWILEDPEWVLGHILHGLASFPGMYRDFISLGLPTLFESDFAKTLASSIGLLYIYLSANRRWNIIAESVRGIPKVWSLIEKVWATPYLSKVFNEYKELKDKEATTLTQEEKDKLIKLEKNNTSFERHLEIIRKREANLDVLIEWVKKESSKALLEEFKNKNLLLKVDTPVYYKKLKDLILITDWLENWKISSSVRKNWLIKIWRDIIYKMTNLWVGDLVDHYNNWESKWRPFRNIIRQMWLDVDFKIWGREFKIKLNSDKLKWRDLVVNNNDFVSERVNKIVNKNVEKIENIEIKNILKDYLSKELNEKESTNVKNTILKILDIDKEIKDFPEDLKNTINDIIKEHINSSKFKKEYEISDTRIHTEFLWEADVKWEIQMIKEISEIIKGKNINNLFIEWLNAKDLGDINQIKEIYKKIDVLWKVHSLWLFSEFDKLPKEKIIEWLWKIEKFIENYNSSTDLLWDKKVIIKTKLEVQRELSEEIKKDLKIIADNVEDTEKPEPKSKDSTEKKESKEKTKSNPETKEVKIDSYIKNIEYLKAIYPNEFKNIDIFELSLEENPKEYSKKILWFDIDLIETDNFKKWIKASLGVNDLKELFKKDMTIRAEFLRWNKKSQFESVKESMMKRFKSWRVIR